MLKLATALVSVSVLVLYGIVASKSAAFSLSSPRGGVFGQAVALLVANLAVWLSQQPERSLSQRFQLVVGGWIWLLVQLGGTLYMLSQYT